MTTRKGYDKRAVNDIKAPKGYVLVKNSTGKVAKGSLVLTRTGWVSVSKYSVGRAPICEYMAVAVPDITTTV